MFEREPRGWWVVPLLSVAAGLAFATYGLTRHPLALVVLCILVVAWVAVVGMLAHSHD